MGESSAPTITEEKVQWWQSVGFGIGYFYGRSVGVSEDGEKEIKERFEDAWFYQHVRLGFRYGYDRGVTDYIELDDES